MTYPSFVDDPLEWCKDVIMPIIGVGGTGLIALLGWRHRKAEQAEAARRAEDHEKLLAERAAENGITTRIQLLLDGYASRIVDLVGEVAGLRSELREMKEDLEYHRRNCATCPHFRMLLEAKGGPSTPIS